MGLEVRTQVANSVLCFVLLLYDLKKVTGWGSEVRSISRILSMYGTTLHVARSSFSPEVCVSLLTYEIR